MTATGRRHATGRTRWSPALAAVALLGLSAVSCTASPERSSRSDEPSATSPPGAPAPFAPGGTAPAASRPPAPATAALPAYPASFTPAPLTWQPCAPAGFECATLAVPLDHAHPDGDRLDLAVSRLPARDPARRIGSLFTNPGGPGASGIASLPSVAAGLGTEVQARFDVIGWDPRGVGGSRPLRCEAAAATYFTRDLGAADPAADVDDAARAWGESCRRTDGAVLAFVGTADNALDLESLRRAAGDDTLTYAGFSYGTEIGLVYAELFPTRVRALLLDGIVDLSADARTAALDQAVGIERALDRFVTWCDAEPSCPLRPDTGTALDALIDRAQQAGVTGPAGAVSPTHVNFAYLLATYGAERWPDLARAVAAALAGDGSPVAALADEYQRLASFSAFLAVTCLDTAQPAGDAFDDLVAEAVARAPRTGAYNVNVARPCTTWPVPPRPLPTTYRAAGTPMIELWGTTGDNATPYAGAVHMASLLESARLVTLDADRHAALGANDCVVRWQSAYLIDREVPPDGTRC